MKFDITIYVYGGGLFGQMEACRLALAKSLVKYDHNTERVLTARKLLFHNKKRKERKKPGLYKARKKFIYKRR